MKIYFASDHAGFHLKKFLLSSIEQMGYAVFDRGPFLENLEDDYPDFIYPLAKILSSEPDSFGIILGGSGAGEAMVANRVRGIRAGVYYGGSLEIVRLLREHNDANVLSLGARFLTEQDAVLAVETFLKTPFPKEERHVRRLQKIDV